MMMSSKNRAGRGDGAETGTYPRSPRFISVLLPALLVIGSLQLLNLAVFNAWAGGGPPSAGPEWHASWSDIYLNAWGFCILFAGLSVYWLRPETRMGKAGKRVRAINQRLLQSTILLGVLASLFGCVGQQRSTYNEESASAADLATAFIRQVHPQMSIQEIEAVARTQGKIRVWAKTTAIWQFALSRDVSVLAYCHRSTEVGANFYCAGQKDFSFIQPAGDPWNGITIQACLTEEDVLTLADGLAKRHQWFDPRFYPDRDARLSDDGKSWLVHYWRVPNRRPGDYFDVIVDDATKEAKVLPGL